MQGASDPYYAWLGIRDARRPPTHYRLLGLEAFEDDPEAIASAAERQANHVRSYLNSPEAFHCHRLLAEVATARMCLLDRARKAPYDAALRQEMAALAAAQAARPAHLTAALATAPQGPATMGAAMSPAQRGTAATSPQPATVPGRAAAAVAAAEDAPEDNVEFRVRLPIGVVIFAIGVLVMAVFAGGRMLLDSRAKQSAEAAAIAAQNRAPLPVPVTEEKAVAKQAVDPTAPVVLPKTADATPAEARTQVLRGHVAPPLSAVFSLDGKLAAAAGEDKTFRWWNAATGELLGSIDRHGDVVTGVVFGRDGRTAATASHDKTVRVWDLDAKSQLHRLRGHTSAVNCVVLTADGQSVLSGSADGTVRQWNLKRGELEKTLTGHTGPVTAIAVAADGRRAVSGGSDAKLCIWDLEGGTEPVTLLETLDRITSIAISPDGAEILFGGANGNLVSAAADGTEIETFLGHVGRIRGVAFVDDYRVASAGDDGTLRFWSRNGGEELERYELPGVPLASLNLAADGTQLITAAGDSSVHVWRVRPLPPLDPETINLGPPPESLEEPGQLRNLAAHKGAVQDVAFSPDGKRFASAGADGAVRLFDVDPPGTITETKPGEAKPAEAKPAEPKAEPAPDPAAPARVERIALGALPVRSVQFSADGALLLAAGGEPGRVGLWNAQTGELVRLFPGHRQSLVTLARFVKTSDGKTAVLSADEDRAVMLWDPANAVELKRLIGAGYGDRWAFAAGTGAVISAGYDRTVRVWDFEFGRDSQRMTLPEDAPWTDRVVASDDGRRIVTGGPDRVLHVWDATMGREVLRLRGHTGGIAALTLSADGARALAGGADLRLWDLASGKTAYEFPGQPDLVECAALSPNGKLAITGDRAGSVRVWRLPKPAPLAADATAVVAAPKPRLAAPDEATLGEAEKDVKKEFLAGVAALDPASKAALAGNLVVAALADETNAARRFALLREGRELAAQAGDLTTAFEAAANLAGEFELDPAAERAEAIIVAAKAARTPEGALQLASAAVVAADRAVARLDLDTAGKLIAVLPALSRKAGGAPLATFGAQRTQRLKALRTAYDKHDLATAQDRLLREPADPQSNLAVGKFLAVDQGEWPPALPRFALASDAAWRKQGLAALAQPTDSAVQRTLAEGWAELAKQAKTGGDKAAAAQLLSQAYVWASRAATSAADEDARTAAAELARGWLAEFAPAKTISLAALPPETVVVGEGTLGLGGLLGYEYQGISLAVFRGLLTPDAISMHPANNGSARATYRLAKQYGQFRAVAAVADSAAGGPLAAPITFRVLADGQSVFQSDRLEAAGESQEFLVDLAGVEKLELIVTVAGSNIGAHALWIEPKLHKK